MPTDEALLQSLRALFRDELQDQLALLRRQVEVLASGGDRAAVITECYRAAHTVKGAAQAALYPSLARYCHALETHFDGARRRGGLDDGILTDAIEVLYRACDALNRGDPLDEALLRRATAALTASAPPRAPPVPPRERATPPVHVSVGRAATSDPPPSAVGETVRLRVREIDRLTHATEEMLALDDRESLSREAANVDDPWAPLFLALGVAERAARTAGAGDLIHAVAHATAAARATSMIAAESSARAERFRRATRTEVVTMSDILRTMRLVALAAVEPWLTQAVAHAAASTDREVVLAFHAAVQQVDRRLIEALREPLLHLVRNAVDHGIESPEVRRAAGKPPVGTVSVRMKLDGLELSVLVEDDGRGVALDVVRATARARGFANVGAMDASSVLQLLFEAGFSTRQQVGDLSGRGVGLDIVRERITALRGRVEIDTVPGAGLKVHLAVPLEVSVTRGLIARLGGAAYVLPSVCVRRVVLLDPALRESVDGHEYLRDEGVRVPICDARRTLGLPSLASDGHLPRNIVIVDAGGIRVALPVEAILAEQEVVVRALGPRLRRTPFVVSATELGEGEVALVIDLVALAHRAVPLRSPPPGEAQSDRVPRILVVDDAATTRHLEAMVLEHAGLHVTAVEDGQRAWETLMSDDAFDAVVTDLEMPRVDGFELLSRIRSTPQWNTLPVVVMTAREDDAARARAVALGANAYLRKSAFDAQTLLALLPMKRTE